jgi:hypothetical protein
VPERVKGGSEQSGVFEFVCDSFPLLVIAVSVVVERFPLS